MCWLACCAARLERRGNKGLFLDVPGPSLPIPKVRVNLPTVQLAMVADSDPKRLFDTMFSNAWWGPIGWLESERTGFGPKVAHESRLRVQEAKCGRCRTC